MLRFILNQAVPRDGLCILNRVFSSWLLFAVPLFGLEFSDSVVTRVQGRELAGARPDPGAPASIERIFPRPSESARNLSCGDLIASRSPGVTVRPTGGIGSYSEISLRGSGAGRVAVFLDDIPLNSGNGTIFNLNALSGALVEGVEVYRGAIPPALSMNGTGGAIRLVSAGKRYGNTLRSMAGAGSYGYQTASLGYLGALPSTRIFATAEFLRARNDYEFVNNGGTPYESGDDFLDIRRNDGFRILNSVGGFSRILSDLSVLSGTLYHSQGRKGLPGMPMAATHTAQVLHNDFSALLQYRTPEALDRGFKAGLAVRRNGYETSYPQNELSYISTVSIRRRDVERMIRPSAEWFMKNGSGTLLALNSDLSLEDFSPEDLTGKGRVDALGADRSALTGGGRFSSKWGRLEPSLSAAVQGVLFRHGAGADRYTSVQLPAGRTTEVFGTGGIALLGHLSDRTKLHATCTRMIQQPALYQLFGDKGATLPSVHLRAEQAINADIGIRGIWGRPGLRGEGSMVLFVSRLTDQIVAEKSYAQVRWANSDLGRIAGLEIAQRAAAGPVELDLAWTFQDPRNMTEDRSNGAYLGKLLPGQGRVQMTTTLTLSPFRWLELSGRYRYRSEYYTDFINDNLHRIPANHLFDTGGRVRLPRAFSIDFNVENITGIRSFDAYGFPVPGRMFLLKLSNELRFNKSKERT